MKNKKFGIVVINDNFFLNFFRDFKPPCGYIRTKHERPSYGVEDLDKKIKKAWNGK